MVPIAYFRALSDKTRVRLLNVLGQKELNVNEIVKILDIGQSRVSHHLRILSESGLVTSRRDGLWAFYSQVQKGPAKAFIQAIQFLLDGDKELAEDLARSKDVLWQRQIETVGFFDSVACDWDRMQRDVIGDVDVTGEILKRIEKCGIAVDLGCGTGRFMTELKAKADTIIGVDRSPKMLNEALKHLSQIKGNFELRIGELEHLPLRDSEADVAVTNFVLHHLASPAEGIHEAFRVLKENGSFIVVDFDKHANEDMRKKYKDRWLGFSKADLEQWLMEAGFKLASATQLDLRQGLKSLLYVGVKK
jgi:ArsR family transcriptional regulator